MSCEKFEKKKKEKIINVCIFKVQATLTLLLFIPLSLETRVTKFGSVVKKKNRARDINPSRIFAWTRARVPTGRNNDANR